MTFYGSRSDEESFEDYISNVNSSYTIPKYDGQWYAVEDSEGVKHIASKASDQSVFAMFSLNGKELGAGELLFDEAGRAKSIYIYGNTIPIALDSLEGTVMVSLRNDPYEGSEATIDMPFVLEKTNARLIKDKCSNLGIENIETKLAITDMYGVEHEIKPIAAETVTKKKSNPIKVTAKTKTVKLKKVKKAAQKAATFTVKKAQGKLSFKIKSAKKAIKKYLTISKKGVLKIKKWKKAKKGKYTIKVTVKANGNANYKSKSVVKTVKVKVK
jgi:hypothetical protein